MTNGLQEESSCLQVTLWFTHCGAMQPQIKHFSTCTWSPAVSHLHLYSCILCMSK